MDRHYQIRSDDGDIEDGPLSLAGSPASSTTWGCPVLADMGECGKLNLMKSLIVQSGGGLSQSCRVPGRSIGVDVGG